MTTIDSLVAFSGPSVVHFYSHATSISFELPIGYAQTAEDGASASYADQASDRPVRVQTRLVARVDVAALARSVSALADGFADQPDTTLVENREVIIDGAPASTVISRRTDGWLLHQTALSGQGELLSVVAMIPSDSPAGTLEAIDRAVESVRVIRL